MHSLLLFCSIWAVNAFSQESRSLYDLNLPNGLVVNVSTTYLGIQQPVGIEIGEFEGMEGVFVTSFYTNKIHFIHTASGCEDTGSCVLLDVAGTGTSGVIDNSFDKATISDPSRMAYVKDEDLLIVTDRANGLIRYLDMNEKYMGTVRTSSGTKIKIVGSAVSDTNPELDVKVFGNYFYVSDSRNVYNLTGSDETLRGSLSSGVLTQYKSLKQWQLLNTYDISQQKVYIQTLAINPVTNKMYVGYTYARSSIVEVPLRCRDSSEIRVLSSDGVIYDVPRTYPIPRNGMLNSEPISSYALVTFPMHMVYDEVNDILYWTEVHSHMTDYKLGAVALRRLKFSSEGTGVDGCSCAEADCNCGYIDYYAGDVGTYRPVLGRSVSYRDGVSDVAKFRTPLSLALTSNSIGPVVYIADSGSSAVRKVHTVVDTPNPTASPTISQAPTLSPTVSHMPTSRPTVSPTFHPTPSPSVTPTGRPLTASPSSSLPSAQPTHSPSFVPSAVPSYSQSPTFGKEPSHPPTSFNGQCLELFLLDEFGDGWIDAALAVNHSIFLVDDVTNVDLPLKPKPKPKPKPKKYDVDYYAYPDDSNVITKSDMYLVTSSSNPRHLTLCTSMQDNGPYDREVFVLQIVGLTSSKIMNAWEIHWEVMTPDGSKYQGSSETQLVFEYRPAASDAGDTSGSGLRDSADAAAGEFAVLIDNHVVKDEKCQPCKHPKPKPKPKPKPSPTPNRSEERAKSPEATIPFELHSKKGIGWISPPSRERGSAARGTKFTISDVSQTELLASGSICAETFKDDCEISLPDGDYFFRVGGVSAEDYHDVAWTFCKVHSSASQELSFAVVDGECVPGALQRASAMADTTRKTMVTMKGELVIENIFEDELSVASTEALEVGIANALSLERENVAVVHVCKPEPGPSSPFCSGEWGLSDTLQVEQSESKTPKPFSFDVVFVLSFAAESFGVVGTHFYDVVDVCDTISSEFYDKFMSGELQESVREAASDTEEAKPVSYARIMTSISPVKTDVSYKYVSMRSAAVLADGALGLKSEIVVVDETLEQESLFFIPVGIIAVVVAAVVAFTHRRQSSTDDDALPSSTSWRENVLVSSHDKKPTDEHSDYSYAAEGSSESKSFNRVDFDSMFGSRHRSEEMESASSSGISGNLPTNRYTQPESGFRRHIESSLDESEVSFHMNIVDTGCDDIV